MLMCIHLGQSGQALLHDFFALAPSVVTRRMARGFHKAKDLGAYIGFGGGVKSFCTWWSRCG